MRKTPLRRRSAKTEAWMKLYRAELATRKKKVKTCQRCKADCGKLDGHHYAGTRHGANVLRFVIIGRRCHDELHARPNMARERGWLANINGTLSAPIIPSVADAEKRFTELTANNPTP